MIENIDTAVARVKAAGVKTSSRTVIVNEMLKGTANFKSPEGKTLMQKRALFVTRLRTSGVWP